jgi:hypothetical protein
MRRNLYVIKRNIGARLNTRGKIIYNLIGSIGGSLIIIIALTPIAVAFYIFSKM